MRAYFLGPRIGPARFGVSVGPEDRRNVRQAKPGNWTVRFVVTCLLILPVFTIGLLAQDPFIGPSGAGGLYGFVALMGASAYAGVRMGLYDFPLVPTALRWCATFVGAVFCTMLLTAFISAGIGL